MATKNKSAGTQYTARGVTQGNTLIDPVSGYPIDVIVDGSGNKRLAVDANITAQDITVEVELDATNDSVRLEDPDTGAHVKVNVDGSIDANIEVDSEDGDTIAIGAYETPLEVSAANTITTIAYTTIFSYTSSNSNTRVISLSCTASTPAIFQVKLDGVVIRQLRSSPLERNIHFDFKSHKTLNSGQVLTIEAKVDRLVLAGYDTYCYLQGYIK